MTWGPAPLVLGTTALLAAVTAAGAVLLARTGDGPGALLMGFVAVALTGGTLYGFLVRPKLVADTDGVTVRMPFAARRVPWPELRARLATHRRLGRDTQTLELEIPAGVGQDPDEPELVVLGRLELGEDPDDVLTQLNRIRGF